MIQDTAIDAGEGAMQTDGDRTKTKLEWALEQAAEGFYVFPITPGQKAPPLIKDFAGNATRDPEQIKTWWTRWPDANIGIYTGKFGDHRALIVVDVDTAKKGATHG
jgi:hypothetical protein